MVDQDRDQTRSSNQNRSSSHLKALKDTIEENRNTIEKLIEDNDPLKKELENINQSLLQVDLLDPDTCKLGKAVSAVALLRFRINTALIAIRKNCNVQRYYPK